MKKTVQILPLGGQSNSGSLLAAMEKLGVEVRWILPGDSVKKSEPLVIPGVGTFEGAMSFLENSGLREEILQHGGKSSPLLGICLGYQILHSNGVEGAKDKTNGLGLLAGQVESLGEGEPKLNVGWRRVFRRDTGQKDDEYFYFCHSYYVRPSELTLEVSFFHDLELTASSSKENIVGYQYHPELSGIKGLQRISSDLKL